ncbi:SDR family oxidoreductase [Alginatibacterium sediminis]|uniref:SDR family oxidoreductase n=1 Tax=Alginatibacterium sediminis TaxID=2164068 RepID=A0A420E6M6_9ALTE|nr:SDR family oxidoreductase [Alginatibacterium sediminis]RKF13685.1 SDR family oxidoreductase [Alginatibacterium sediminis]
MQSSNKRILVVGSTGYLGLHIIEHLQGMGADFKALARNDKKLCAQGVHPNQIRLAQVSEPSELKGVCDNIDVVISCLGITRQRDGLGYMDIDYQANLNLLLEAERAGASKFIYISAFNAPIYQDVRILKAKEKFVRRLLASEVVDGCVIRPNGFFSDMTEIFNMAKAGRVHLFGDGSQAINPIHGQDLANFVVACIDANEQQYDLGGPTTLTLRDIANLAFDALDKPSRITYYPDSLRKLILAVVKRLPEKWGGPAEFFLSIIAKDSVAPSYGDCQLKDYYQTLANK